MVDKSFKNIPLEKLSEAVEYLINSLNPKRENHVVFMKGEIGSGKTTFVSKVAELLGISKRLVSPTFTIVRNYEIDNDLNGLNRLIHIDLYRLEKVTKQMFTEFGMDDQFINKKSIVFIEWPERLGFELEPEFVVEIVHAEDKRDIHIWN